MEEVARTSGRKGTDMCQISVKRELKHPYPSVSAGSGWLIIDLSQVMLIFFITITISHNLKNQLVTSFGLEFQQYLQRIFWHKQQLRLNNVFGLGSHISDLIAAAQKIEDYGIKDGQLRPTSYYKYFNTMLCPYVHEDHMSNISNISWKPSQTRGWLANAVWSVLKLHI